MPFEHDVIIGNQRVALDQLRRQYDELAAENGRLLGQLSRGQTDLALQASVIERLLEVIRCARDGLEHIASGVQSPSPNTIALDTLIQMSVALEDVESALPIDYH